MKTTKLNTELEQIKNDFEMGLITHYERANKEFEAKKYWTVTVKKYTK